MKYIIEKGSEFYLKDSLLENIFINEYMAGADGEYVKVYVYARMYAQHGYPMEVEDMAQQLGISRTHVEEAWLYWESVGAVKLIKGASEIEGVKFLNLKERYLGLSSADDEGEAEDAFLESAMTSENSKLQEADKNSVEYMTTSGREPSEGRAFDDGVSMTASIITPEQIAAEIEEQNQNTSAIGIHNNSELNQFNGEGQSILVDQEYKELLHNMESLLGRPLSTIEAKEIARWKNQLKMDTNVIIRGVLNCLDMNKDNFNYIAKVIENWGSSGVRTEAELDKYLLDRNDKLDRYKRVMRALGFEHRNPTEQEKLLMDKWFNQMGYGIDKVLEACAKTAGIPKPSFNYVNKVLENWQKEAVRDNRNVNESKPVSRKVVREYMEYLRKKAEKEAEARKQEIYQRFPAIEEIDKKSLNIGLRLSKAMVGHQTDENLKELSNQLNELAEERAYILSANNYDVYYTEKKYCCDKCNDMGVTEMAAECSCMKQRTKEAELWQKEKEIGINQREIIEQSMKKSE